MSLDDVVWYPAAVQDLLALPHWRDAEQVAAAVRIYAERSIGFLRRVTHEDSPDEESRLYVGAYYARIRVVDASVHVERIVRWRG